MLKVLAASIFALLAACETTETTTAVSTIETLPELALVAKLDTFTNSGAETARKKLEVRFARAVYAEAITPAYWRDDLRSDLVLLIPVDDRTEMIKVEIVGSRKYVVTSGNRNGRSFKREGLLPAGQ